MRILENCTSAWPTPEMQTQIDSLREAFSADTTRPFELKRSFPFASPSSSSLQPSPPLDAGHPPPMLTRHESHGQLSQMPYHAQPITPPVSAGFEMPKDASLPSASMAMMSNSQQHTIPMQSSAMNTSQVEWNPTPIFKYVSGTFELNHIENTNDSFSQWSTAFGTSSGSSAIPPASGSISQHSPPLYTSSAISTHPISSIQSSIPQQQQSYPFTSSMPPLSRVQTAPQISPYTTPTPSFVTSSMWRDTVASTYDSAGLKRRWGGGDDSSFLLDTTQTKRRA